MATMTWVLMLYMIATGEKMIYKDEYTSAAECKKAHAIVKAQILKDNPQVKEGQEPYVLVCEPKKAPKK